MEITEKAQWRLALGYRYLNEEPRNVPAAVREFRRVTELAPLWSEGYALLSLALEEIGQIDGAIAVCREALRVAPEEARHAIFLGGLFVRKRDYSKAIRTLLRGISLSPHSPEVGGHLLRGQALAGVGRIREAREEWQFVMTPEPVPCCEGLRTEAERMPKE